MSYTMDIRQTPGANGSKYGVIKSVVFMRKICYSLNLPPAIEITSGVLNRHARITNTSD